ncbi:hypothetical protein Acsp04_13280 [Actinomadura sp. NBRC 104425]|nr:hypothetical protein Acsp04_13280 [Actinomadura sp. NBRC 104425]
MARRSTQYAIVDLELQATSVSDSALTIPIFTARELSRGRGMSCGGKGHVLTKRDGDRLADSVPWG